MAPTYHDVLLSPDYAPGATGGGEWKVRIVRLPSGRERRFEVSEDAVYRYQIDYPKLGPAARDGLKSFWHARRGSTHAFRFKDLSDFEAENEPLAPTGAPTVQLVKTYDDDANNPWVREIYAPAGPSPTNTVSLRKNAAPFAGYSLNLTTGLVTLTALAGQSIISIALGSSTTIGFGVAPNAAFTLGSLLYLSGIGGTTQLNGQVGEVTSVLPAGVIVDIDSTGYSAYTSGGTAAKYLHAGDTLDWSGEFHVPVRFDMAWPEFGVEAPGWHFLSGVQLLELRE